MSLELASIIAPRKIFIRRLMAELWVRVAAIGLLNRKIKTSSSLEIPSHDFDMIDYSRSEFDPKLYNPYSVALCEYAIQFNTLNSSWPVVHSSLKIICVFSCRPIAALSRLWITAIVAFCRLHNASTHAHRLFYHETRIKYFQLCFCYTLRSVAFLPSDLFARIWCMMYELRSAFSSLNMQRAAANINL